MGYGKKIVFKVGFADERRIIFALGFRDRGIVAYLFPFMLFVGFQC